MPIVHGAQRLWTPPAPSGPIVGKPVVPFQPNTGYQYFPNESALYFTNLISGQTPYVDDTIAGRADFAYSGGTMGVHALGEGYDVVVSSSAVGGEVDVGHIFTESFAMVIECEMTKAAAESFVYLCGWGTSNGKAIGPKNTNCSNNGIFYTSTEYCLGDIADGALHRIGIHALRQSGNFQLSIAVDGALIHDKVNDSVYIQRENFRIGKNSLGRGDRIMATGIWHWSAPFDTGQEAIPLQELVDLTVDPWPYLAVLD